MKKFGLIVALLVTVGSAQAFAWGIGGVFGLNILDNAIPGAGLTLKLDESPLVFGIGASIGSQATSVGITADYWALNDNLVSFVNYYVGFGGYLNLSLAENSAVDLGIRIPVGINIFPIDPFELFFEIAPSVGLDLGTDPITIPDWGLQGSFGFRFWF